GALPQGRRRSGAPRSGEPGTHNHESLGSNTTRAYGFRAPAFGRPRNDGCELRIHTSSMRGSVTYAALRYAAVATGTAHSRLIASTMAVGFAMPFPAMSNALPCATDENRIGVPMARPVVAFCAS